MCEHCDIIWDDPPTPTLSDILRDLDPNAPPAAPLNILSTVKFLFTERYSRLRDKRIAREKAEEEARIAAIRAARAKKKPRPREKQNRIAPPLRVKDAIPSAEEIEALIDDEVAQEAKGLGLKRTKGESRRQYDKRMRALEERVDLLAYVEYHRKQQARLQYVEGMPVNLIEIHPHVRPITVNTDTAMHACLQCKVTGRRCSRNSDKSSFCERCGRNGERCLAKTWFWKEDKDAEAWKITRGEQEGREELVEEWLGKLRMKIKGQSEGIPAMPMWHKNDHLENLMDPDYEPERWCDKLKEVHVTSTEE
ncbi:hypothetical protein F66182_19 [Fusarium sp. NRRL 66182]|nr:hypothetical protein F66182_19 [Fusarium sp. NRRL 66182]